MDKRLLGKLAPVIIKKQMTYSKLQVKLRMIMGYLLLSIRTKCGKSNITNECSASEEDLTLVFWGDEEVRDVQNELGLSPRERTLLAEGDILGKYVPREKIIEWVTERKAKREKREESVEKLEKSIEDLSKLFFKEARRSKKAINKKCSSDIIQSMDGSSLLWLSVISSAVKDFLRWHDDDRRIPVWERLKLIDLLDENGDVKRGYEDAWSYLTAREFLFNDNYKINLGDPNSTNIKAISCKELLEAVVSSDSGTMNPSIEHLRSTLSKKSGDPKLIKKYYIENLD